MGSWDRGVDFASMYDLLVNKLKREIRKDTTDKCYYGILLTQLRNGSRISEAVRAFQLFLKTEKYEVEVLVSKRKDGASRLMIIPYEVRDLRSDSVCFDLRDVPEEKLASRVEAFALRKLKVNTHSLRYAFITYLLKNGTNPAILAKITGHKRLDHILTYTQEKAAKEVLERLV